MSYTPGIGRAMNDMFDSYAASESLDLPKDEFLAKNAKAFKIACIIASIAGIIGGALMFFLLKEDREIALLFFTLGICMLLLLPTMLSYKCLVNKTIMQEEYFILFFKRKREILWSNVKYRTYKIRKNKVLKLYDKNKKLLISFDGSVVGFDRIVKLSKKMWIYDMK